MTPDLPSRPNATPRHEKLSALAELLGPETMAQLRKRNAGFDAPRTVDQTVDADRVEWQRNRLLARLRAGRAAEDTETLPREQRADAATRVDAHITGGLKLEDLAGEHPAVIARVLKSLGRADRIAALRALPGQTARAALRRLKDDGQTPM